MIIHSQPKITVHIVIGPLVFFLLLGFRRFSLYPSIFDPDISWLSRLLFLLIHLLQVIILVVTPRLIFHLNPFQLSRVFFVIEAHVFAEQDEEPETFEVVRVLLIDGLVDFKGFLVVHDTSLATGHHESPLDLFGLDLTRPFQVK
jgi:hypothetical protein